jgi:hypothetical protein
MLAVQRGGGVSVSTSAERVPDRQVVGGRTPFCGGHKSGSEKAARCLETQLRVVVSPPAVKNGNRIRMYAGPVSWVSNDKHWL